MFAQNIIQKMYNIDLLNELCRTLFAKNSMFVKVYIFLSHPQNQYEIVGLVGCRAQQLK